MKYLLSEKGGVEEDDRWQCLVDGLGIGCRRGGDCVVQIDGSRCGFDSGVRHVGRREGRKEKWRNQAAPPKGCEIISGNAIVLIICWWRLFGVKRRSKDRNPL